MTDPRPARPSGGDPVTVVARYRTRPGAGERVAEVLAEHVAASRGEPGCLGFSVLRSADAPEEFVLVERYRDEDALGAHRQTPHFRRFVEGQVISLLAERTWQLYREIAPAGA